MSASTSSYSSLLGGMWAPEGSEINDRLRRLQELENMRKEREAKRQEIIKNVNQSTTGVISRSARAKPQPVVEVKEHELEPFSLSAGLGLRRAMSLREDSENKENYGGARPKVGGFGKDAGENDGSWSLFSDVKSSLMGPRRTLRSDYTTTTNRTRFDSTDSEDSTTTSSSYLKSKLGGLSDRPGYSGYGRSVSQEGGSSLFSYPRSTTYHRQTYLTGETGGYDGEVTEEVEYTENMEENHINGHQETNGHEEYHDVDDEGEEPLHFIERLKNGGSRRNSDSNNNINLFGSIPAVPPYNQTNNDDNGEDIISVAKNISTAFGNGGKSPTSPNNMQYTMKASEVTHTVDNPDASFGYDFVTVDNDSSGDEEGKRLTLAKNVRLSQWGVVETGPGDLDEMQAFFTGKSVDHDPNISRVLDGEKLRGAFDDSFSEQSFSAPKETSIKEARKSSKDSDTGSDKGKPTDKKKPKPKVPEKPTKKKASPVDKVKNSHAKGSGSENDSKPNSESEGETLEKQPGTGSKPSPPKSPKTDRSNSLTEKLNKLEAMTSEKTRRKSQGENELKRSVPSYMSGTSSSKMKNSRTKDATSPKPYARDLKKDVRELRQFVRENSVPNSPASSTGDVQSMIVEIEPVPKPEMKEMGVQTDIAFTVDQDYVCKHCGKSSAEEVTTTLTKKNLEMTIGKGSDKGKSGSQGSVKSFGSSKSDKTFVKPKSTSSTTSYMKGTTASRLKNSQTDLTNGTLMSAEHMLYPDNAGSKAKTNGKLGVAQKAKSFETKSKPTLSVFRATSTERQKQLEMENKQSKLSKSKSVDQVHLLKNATKKTFSSKVGTTKMTKPKETNIDLNDLHSPRTPKKAKKPIVSPRSAPTSPRRKEVLDIEIEPVESKGQFTTLDNNPFIQNDSKHRSSSNRSTEGGESVWTKACSPERVESRSDSTADSDKVSVGTSSGGEGRSLSRLSWSDSGSRESLNKSRSESHGSNSSLNKDVFDSPRSRKTSTSSTGQSVTSPVGSPKKGGVVETDIDAAFMKSQKKSRTPSIEHNEETVERAHREFAKNACHMLDIDVKKGKKVNGTTNGTANGHTQQEVEANNPKQTKTAPKKGKRGFLKGKFKK